MDWDDVRHFLADTGSTINAPIPYTNPDPCPHVEGAPPTPPPYRQTYPEGSTYATCVKSESEWNERLEKCEKYFPDPCQKMYDFPLKENWDDDGDVPIADGIDFHRNPDGPTRADNADASLDAGGVDLVHCGWSLAKQMGNEPVNWALCMALDDDEVDRNEGACISRALRSQKVWTGSRFLSKRHDLVIQPAFMYKDDGSPNVQTLASTSSLGGFDGEIRLNLNSPSVDSAIQRMGTDNECIEGEHECACVFSATTLLHEVLHWCSDMPHASGGCDKLNSFTNALTWLVQAGAGPSRDVCCPYYADPAILSYTSPEGYTERCGAGCTGSEVGVGVDPAEFLGGSGLEREADPLLGFSEPDLDESATLVWLNGG